MFATCFHVIKTVPFWPRYIINVSLFCRFLVDTGDLKYSIRSKHLVLTIHSKIMAVGSGQLWAAVSIAYLDNTKYKK